MSRPIPPPTCPVDRFEWLPTTKPVAKGGTREHSCLWVPYLKMHALSELLDEWVGPDAWVAKYRPADDIAGVVGGSPGVWCDISITFDDGATWITKSDIGTPSSYEKAKGVVTDAFKRCASHTWGVGRNVYDTPSFWAFCRVDNKGNPHPTERTRDEIAAQLEAWQAAEHVIDLDTVEVPDVITDDQRARLMADIGALDDGTRLMLREWFDDNDVQSLRAAKPYPADTYGLVVAQINELTAHLGSATEAPTGDRSSGAGTGPPGDAKRSPGGRPPATWPAVLENLPVAEDRPRPDELPTAYLARLLNGGLKSVLAHLNEPLPAVKNRTALRDAATVALEAALAEPFLP